MDLAVSLKSNADLEDVGADEVLVEVGVAARCSALVCMTSKRTNGTIQTDVFFFASVCMKTFILMNHCRLFVSFLIMLFVQG